MWLPITTSACKLVTSDGPGQQKCLRAVIKIPVSKGGCLTVSSPLSAAHPLLARGAPQSLRILTWVILRYTDRKPSGSSTTTEQAWFDGLLDPRRPPLWQSSAWRDPPTSILQVFWRFVFPRGQWVSLLPYKKKWSLRLRAFPYSTFEDDQMYWSRGPNVDGARMSCMQSSCMPIPLKTPSTLVSRDGTIRSRIEDMAYGCQRWSRGTRTHPTPLPWPTSRC